MKFRAHWFEPLSVALALLILSNAWMALGLHLGERVLPRGPGYQDGVPDLVRFDAQYYLSIARDGYAYDGNPASSPNIVFAPLFPLAVRACVWIFGGDEVATGLWLNQIWLGLAFLLLYLWLRERRSRGASVTLLAALATTSGAYALHAYYSEASMLILLAAVVLALARRWTIVAALASAGLGASRLAALPLALATGGVLLYREWTSSWRARVRAGLLALTCVSGAAAYLAYIAVQFGSPFALLPKIQATSWALFHPEVDTIKLFTGWYLIEYTLAAAQKGSATFTDIQTLNLLWMWLGLASCGWASRSRRDLAALFVPYALFIYASSAASPFLISVHRFFLLQLPIFLMFDAGIARLWRRHPRTAWIMAGGVLAVNGALGLLFAAAFNQGLWFWF